MRGGRQTDITKQTVAFRNFLNAPKNKHRSAVNYIGSKNIGKIILSYFWRDSPPPVDQDLLFNEVSRSHTTTHHCR